MALSANRSRVKGAASLRRLLRNMPDALRDEMIEQILIPSGNELLRSMRAAAPVGATGRLRQGLAMKVLRKSLKMRVGYLTKAMNRKLFYGWIIEWGRKAKTVIVVRNKSRVYRDFLGMGGRGTRYKKAALKSQMKGVYELNVRARAPQHFVYRKNATRVVSARINYFWKKALQRAASGAMGTDNA